MCAVCTKNARHACSACNGVYYCDREHQKEDWKRHKSSCAPFKVQTDEILGRCLVATRNIKAGEIIMRKLPLILGPKTVSAALCLGCHKKLNLEQSFRYDCSKCHWPLCNQSCEETPLHMAECEIFAKARYTPTVKNDNSKQSVYSCIAPLRALLLKVKEPSKFETLIKCQSHLQEHLATQVYQVLRRNLIPFFVNVLKFDTNEKEIMNICSIFDTNCFEVRDTKGLVNVRGLYPVVSLLSHDCKHNTKHAFYGDDFQLVLTATIPIKKGDLITTTYTQTLWGTHMRRAHLKMSKHFDCVCERCKDPTELGSYAGAIYCTRCKSVDRSNENKIISCDPLDQDANWKCEGCGYLVEGKEMIWGNEVLKKEISQLDKKSPAALENFLVKYQGVLHSKNAHFLEVKYALCQMYGNLEGFQLVGK
ncbi:zf-MYND and/or SET domain containing protein [Asbolus verrucosus]|uniref:Zf-MYND and/or SET domain containing protein n=1 Tax=Asbolus verrucosus TaxID=1661398 RepID=A0A482V9F8_ASBVE|nr:zf-MYND and/or SET domain containing protein [Asbolus verrucosus]